MSALAPTSLEVVELDEALDFEPPCDATPECSLPVAWSGRFGCCGEVTICCDRHRKAIDAALVMQSIGFNSVTHIPCDHIVHAIMWEPYRKGDR